MKRGITLQHSSDINYRTDCKPIQSTARLDCRSDSSSVKSTGDSIYYALLTPVCVRLLAGLFVRELIEQLDSLHDVSSFVTN